MSLINSLILTQWRCIVLQGPVFETVIFFLALQYHKNVEQLLTPCDVTQTCFGPCNFPYAQARVGSLFTSLKWRWAKENVYLKAFASKSTLSWLELINNLANLKKRH